VKLDLAAPAERLFDGCWRISLPDPFIPHVTSAYLLDSGTDAWLVDAGADSEESATALRAKLEQHGTEPDVIAGCILSHSHLDHAGGLLHWRPRHLVAHEHTAAEMSNLSPRSSRGPEALRRMGVPDSLVEAMAPHGEPVQVRLASLDVDTKLSGESGTLGGAPGWTWHVAEGHAPGHLMFFHADSRSLLGGDQFLERWKTPYLISDPTVDSFGAYLDSVKTAIVLEPRIIYPSHTRAIRPAGKWLQDRRETLLQQRERTLEATGGGARSAFEAVRSQYREDLKPGLIVLLLREQLAILRHLAANGALGREEVEGVELFG
jgi:glyoxylase-like metal-dependent hydrolase (beta-lactamase superfamily II)